MTHKPSPMLAAATATAALIGLISACSSGAGTGGKSGSALTIGIVSAPNSLDPTLGGNNAEGLIYSDLAYAPLITLNGDGSLSPGLATSWKYTDATLTTFTLSLRPNAKFSDGSPVTASAVVNSLRRTKTAVGGLVTAYANMIKSADATGPYTVVLHLAQRNPSIALVLTQRFLVGDIIGPRGLANPKALTTSTDGAGQYTLDSSGTVANQTYTYAANPKYWDQSKIHFKKVIVRVIPNPQTAYNALKSGQVDLIDGSPSTVSEAAGNGSLAVYSTPASWYGIDLIDRAGSVVPALASEKVRQALNYAVDRAAITKALFGKYGEPTSQITDSGYDGYDPSYNNHYAYDPNLAKSLLAQAGYPNGFSMTIAATPQYGDGVEVAQVIASYWEKIGVRARISTSATITPFGNEVTAGKTPAFAMQYDAQPMFLEATQLLDTDAGFFNQFKTAEPQLTALIAAARVQTKPAAIASAWSAVQRRVVDLGWFVPVALGPVQFYATKKLHGVNMSVKFSSPDPTQMHF